MVRITRMRSQIVSVGIGFSVRCWRKWRLASIPSLCGILVYSDVTSSVTSSTFSGSLLTAASLLRKSVVSLTYRFDWFSRNYDAPVWHTLFSSLPTLPWRLWLPPLILWGRNIGESEKSNPWGGGGGKRRKSEGGEGRRKFTVSSNLSSQSPLTHTNTTTFSKFHMGLAVAKTFEHPITEKRSITEVDSLDHIIRYMTRSVSLLRIPKEWILPAVTPNHFNAYMSCFTTLLIFTAIFEPEV